MRDGAQEAQVKLFSELEEKDASVQGRGTEKQVKMEEVPKVEGEEIADV